MLNNKQQPDFIIPNYLAIVYDFHKDKIEVIELGKYLTDSYLAIKRFYFNAAIGSTAILIGLANTRAEAEQVIRAHFEPNFSQWRDSGIAARRKAIDNIIAEIETKFRDSHG